MQVSGGHTPQVVAVLGTGAMAPEIAVACAGAGYETLILGRDAARAEAAAEWCRTFVTDATVTSGLIDEPQLSGVDLVIETIVEDLAVKHDVLARVEAWCTPGTPIVTNTSSLTIARLAECLQRPDHFAGLHFLKPAHLTGVVEVIPGPDTGAEVIAVLRHFVDTLGKTPLNVRRDVPGFIWNRIQFAVLRECLHMVDQGVADPADIDAAVCDGLAPRWVAAGPLATADLGGLKTFRRVSAQLFPHLARETDVSDELTRRADDGGRFAPWTAGDAEAVAALRAHALEAGRRIAAERREISPP